MHTPGILSTRQVAMDTSGSTEVPGFTTFTAFDLAWPAEACHALAVL